MAFHFPLESLLTYRQNLERKCELALHQAVAEASKIQREIQNVDLAAAELRDCETTSLQPGMRASELQWNGLQRIAFRSRREWLGKKLAEAERMRTACLQDLQRAKQQRGTVERLRQQRWVLYCIEIGRREQRQLDDLFLSRRFYLANSPGPKPE
jgi:flagellar export protein FliJ